MDWRQLREPPRIPFKPSNPLYPDYVEWRQETARKDLRRFPETYPEVKEKLQAWQHALLSWRRITPFRPESLDFDIDKPNIKLGIVRLMGRDGQVESEFHIFDDLFSGDKRKRPGAAAESDRQERIYGSDSDLLNWRLNPLPFNLIRYTVLCWHKLTDAEKQRAVEVLAGWIASSRKREYFVDLPRIPQDVHLEDYLPGEVTLRTPASAPPPLIIWEAQDDEEYDELRSFLPGYASMIVRDWCRKHANAVGNALVREYRTSSKASSARGLAGNQSVKIDGGSPPLDSVALLEALPDLSIGLNPLADLEAREELAAHPPADFEATRVLAACWDQFTDQEQKVLTLKGQGVKRKAIARGLGLSEARVKQDLENAYNIARKAAAGSTRKRRKRE